MEFLFALFVVLLVGRWFWKTRQQDKQTNLDFDIWLSKYGTATSAWKRSGMAVAFLTQSIHLAWTMGAINSKQKEVISGILKKQGADTTMVTWLGSALPVVTRIVGKEDVANSPARTVGMLMLLAWMSSDSEKEDAIRRFLSRM